MTLQTPYHHGNLKEALISEALSFVEDAGLSSLSLRKIAAALGVNPTALYAHFKNKDSLIAELARKGYQRLAEKSDDVLESGSAPGEALALYAGIYLDFAQKQPELFKLMFSPDFAALYEHDRSLKRLSETSFQNFSQMIANYLAAKNSTRDPHIVTLSAWSIVHGFCHLVIGERLPAEQLSENKTSQLLNQLLRTLQTGIDPR